MLLKQTQELSARNKKLIMASVCTACFAHAASACIMNTGMSHVYAETSMKDETASDNAVDYTVIHDNNSVFLSYDWQSVLERQTYQLYERTDIYGSKAILKMINTEDTDDEVTEDEMIETYEETARLEKTAGTFDGPCGKETWYNLPMSGVVKLMRALGFLEEDGWTYWEREDGVKMFGDYVMVAANLEVRPKGTIVDTSLGKGIVCDTGDFAKAGIVQLDIAVNW
jgi:hypothetical protein